MNIHSLLSLATTLHMQSMRLLPAYHGTPENGKVFMRWHTGDDRFYPRIDHTPLNIITHGKSAHERLSALEYKAAAEKTFEEFSNALAGSYLLGGKTHVELRLGLTPNGFPTYHLYLDETTAHNTQNPTTIGFFEKKLEAIKTAVDTLAAVIDQDDHILFKETTLGTVVSAPTPAAAAMKLKALLSPTTLLTDDGPDLHTHDMATYHDPERILDRVADIERNLKRKEHA